MGWRRALAGLLLEVRPLPMAAAILVAVLGVTWAQGRLFPLDPALPWLAATVFFGLYAAHLMDTYVDVVKRNDLTPDTYPLLFRDSSGYLPPRAYPVACAASVVACVYCAWVPVAAAGAAVAVPLTVGVCIALAYAPFLDRRLLGVSLGYPVGAFAAYSAGYMLISKAPDERMALLGVPILIALVGTKVRSDVIDLEDDRRINKRTVPVVLGERAALVGGYGLAVAGLLAAAALPWMTPAREAMALPPLAAAAVVVATFRMHAFRGSMLMAASMFALLAAEVLILAPVGL